MLNLKKTAVAVLALGSSVAFAGTMGPVCVPGNVTVPCESTGWDIGGYALYLQPSHSADFLGLPSATVLGPDVVDLGFGNANPRWRWGFKLEGSYHFCTGNDLNLNWYHLGRNTTTRTFTGFFDPLADLAAAPGTGSFSVRPAWDAVNLEFGQHVDFSEFSSMRFHGGVQYARMKNQVAFAGSEAVDLPLVDVVGFNSNSTYNGFGPRAGADLRYGWGNGFAAYANAAAALLVGSSKLNTSFTTATTAVVPVTASLLGSGSHTLVVPELEAKLGLMYDWAMAQGSLTIDAGWMWFDYINVHRYNPLADVAAFSAASGATFAGIRTGISDFGAQGPYLGLKWEGSVI